MIERLPQTHQYKITPKGLRIATLFVELYNRILRPGLSQLFDGCPKAPDRPVASAIKNPDRALDQLLSEAKMVTS
ncbi:MAG: hypothetical protein KJ558_04730 [Gammaproteobacteria bacterium]|nr:hypothetical protein [Gammaproteobacteria bacterium]MBU1654125.1 hypothetical protein [Gammaproteobacteria bacterium]MBU1960141.1 hypothetical protein [Gammaproteobacteria bacterium]